VTDILDDLAWRGLIAQSTDIDALRAAMAEGPITVYCGFDPTAPSLHVGNLVPLLALTRIQRAGHRAIGLVGGATGLIGDPSGKSEQRSLNSADVVAEWVGRIRVQVEKFLDLSEKSGSVLVSNLDWTAGMSAIDFLRDVGKHFPVNRMLARESVSARLAGEGLSYTEFSYQILQANALHERSQDVPVALRHPQEEAPLDAEQIAVAGGGWKLG
jgi:tyrosyl-tRNA synthetase